MTSWTAAELDAIGKAEELELSSLRNDGSLSAYVTMWLVRVDQNLFVRSAGGPDRPWFQRAKARGAGRIRVSGIEYDVSFADTPIGLNEDIDSAYHAKYDRYGAAIVGHVVGAQAAAVTIKLEPKETARLSTL